MPDLIPPTPPTDGTYEDNFIEEGTAPAVPAAPVEPPAPAAPVEAAPSPPVSAAPPPAPAPEDDLSDRLERLGGEPAPVITPEDFARLQNAGQVHIDAQGRVRTARRTSQADAGVTLRKRRAWYAFLTAR
jgi:hypothetical protein